MYCVVKFDSAGKLSFTILSALIQWTSVIAVGGTFSLLQELRTRIAFGGAKLDPTPRARKPAGESTGVDLRAASV